MKIILLVVVAAVLSLSLRSLSAAEEPRVDLEIAPGQLLVVPSFEAASYYFRPVGAAETAYEVEFRSAAETIWRRGFPPVSDQPPGIWKGSVFNLPEDSAWQLRIVNARGEQVIAPVVCEIQAASGYSGRSGYFV